MSPSGGSRVESILGLFQHLEAAFTPWLVASSSIFKAHHGNRGFHIILSLLPVSGEGHTAARHVSQKSIASKDRREKNEQKGAASEMLGVGKSRGRSDS